MLELEPIKGRGKGKIYFSQIKNNSGYITQTNIYNYCNIIQLQC